MNKNIKDLITKIDDYIKVLYNKGKDFYHMDLNEIQDFESIVGNYDFIKSNMHKEFKNTDCIFTIIYFKDIDVYLSIEGYYNSFEDDYYIGSELEQVWPKEKVYKYIDYLNFEDLQKD